MNNYITAIFSRKISNILIAVTLLVLDFLHQHYLRQLTLQDSVTLAVFDAVLYSGILILTTRLDLMRVTLCFLALPYLIFIPGWLNPPTAILLLIIFIYCISTTLYTTASTSNAYITIRDLCAFIAILMWVNISGVGGYGFQWNDYDINNARLYDLVRMEWPIRYGENQNFVYYFGYFLPSAIIGKLTSVDIALKSVYVWAVIGVTLSIRWLAYLSRWQYSIILVCIFILFGPMDILNVLYINFIEHNNFDSIITSLRSSTHNLDFATSYKNGAFIGNYLSNVFGLYWAPQQIIPGWLCAGVLTHLFMQRQVKRIVFVYALLCLWAPFAMIALFPFILLTVIIEITSKNWRNIFSFENTAGAICLSSVFIIFYFGGSASANPSYWIVDTVRWSEKWDVLLVFYLAAWGIYTLALAAFVARCDSRSRLWFYALVSALALLSIRSFGIWNDLLCRGSAGLMFLLLCFYLKAINDYWSKGKKIIAAVMFCWLIPGSGSALLINNVSWQRYGQTQPVQGLLTYQDTPLFENFGPDNSLFAKWFRRDIPEKTQAK